VNSRTGLNLALVAVVATLAALSYFKPGTQHPAPTVRLIDLKPVEVHEIRVAVPGQKPTDLKLGPQGWQVTAPFILPADPNLMKTLLDYLDVPSRDSFPAAGRDLAQYGLDKPKAELWLNDSDYRFGGFQPVNNEQYVLAGGTIHLVDPQLFYRIDHDAYWWIDKALLPAGAEITALQLPDATLTRDKQGIWQLAPADPKVSADDIQRFLTAWEENLAISVAPIGKDAPQGEVAMSLAGQKAPLRFAILKDPDFLVLARPDLGIQYDLDDSLKDTLLRVAHAAPAAAKTK